MDSGRPSAAANLRGILAMIASQGVFILSDAIIKVAGQTLPPGQIMAYRGIMATYLVGAILVATVNWRKMYMVLRPLVVLRAIAEAAAAALFIAALQHLSLNTITAVSQVTPLILAFASAMILGERVGPARWYAATIGFIGVMLVLQPTKEGLSIHAVTALLMALVVAARELITRHITAEVPTNVITFTSTMGVCLAGFAGIDTQPWVPLTANNFTLLFVSAILVTMGVWFVVVAFREVEVSVVSPFRYSAVLWAALFGFLVWNEIPNDLAIIGTALIVMSGIFAMHQDSQSARERAAAQQPAE